ncbi:hypothetical protein O6H91_02G097300 [Diphasiastrum complanatum]|uniref:Uncharacterized protein n=1 Tax=Diphasiastrum complanatum TaxID=34168 RepID=A0ACC2EJ07_DIPCM|nr:hypothetical protein O6H91_02G097300 [Diphasiastrum complanatum]
MALQTCCHKFLSSFLRTGFTRKSTAPFDRHLNTISTESRLDITAILTLAKIRWFLILHQKRHPQVMTTISLLVPNDARPSNSDMTFTYILQFKGDNEISDN